MWKQSIWPIFLAAIALALTLGYLLATPDDLVSFGTVGLVLFCLCIPLLLRWHYAILLFSWNAWILLFFLPGSPLLWALMAFLSLGISILQRAINRGSTFLAAPSITLPLIFLGAVVLITAKLTGGIGVAALGSSNFGGKKYFSIIAAIVGYFALISQSIPKDKAKVYTVLFFLSGLTAVVSNLAYFAGPAFYFLYQLFPADFALGQARADFSIYDQGAVRIAGLHFATLAIFGAVLCSGDLRDVFNLRKLWKLLLLVFAAFAGLFSGFRSLVILLALTFVLLFFIQKLYRTSLLPKLLAGGILSLALMLPFVSKMPFPVQRALSILPIEIDSSAKIDAEASSEWRLQMWRVIVPQIPQYFWKGKGYGIDPSDLYLTELRVDLGMAKSSDLAMLAGDYHSGPLSLIIPFGIFGVISFVWFLAACLHALHRNYKYGDPSLRYINSFLLAYFWTKTIFYFAVFGSLHSDLVGFVGLIGLSISLNRGIKRKPALETEHFKTVDQALVPA